MESMLGFRQDLGFAGSVQSVAAVALHPEVDAAGSEGLDEAAVRTWETMHLGDEMEAEAGSSQVLARMAANSPNTVAAVQPFASAGWREGNSTFSYRISTLRPGSEDRDESEAGPWLPAVSLRNGHLALEHGLHQEIGWERRTDTSGVQVLVYSDKVDNPVIEAMGRLSAGDPGAAAVLLDQASGLLRTAGPNFSSSGVLAAVQGSLPGGSQVGLSYANGEALVMPAAARNTELAPLLAGVHPRHAQMYSLSLSGTLEGTGTRWRASYRWQPEETVSAVAPYALDGPEPYLNVRLRQPIHLRGDGASHFQALLEMRNLLAQGYRPYLLSDGSLLIFAQDQRGIRGGLAFTF
jgi:hypothetical protein